MPALATIQSTEERIARIEHGLLPDSPLPSLPSPPVSLAQRMETLATPGVSVAVIEDGKIAWARGWGVREAGQPDPVTTETLFQAASISKSLTAFAVLRLVEEGRLDLDENVNVYLTSWTVPANGGWQPRVTLRQLLSHTGGTTISSFPGYPPGGTLPTAAQVLDGVPPANTGPVVVSALPGTLNRYSGGGTMIVQQVLVDLLGKPFPQIMREWVLDPVGMARSTFEQPLPPHLWREAATAHPSGGTPQPGRWHVYPEMAAAGLWTTPTDLALFAVALQRAKTRQPNALLSGETVDRMMTPQLKGGQGLGVTLGGPEDAPRFGHGGWNLGFVSDLNAYQDRGIGCVVMLNSNQGFPLLAEVTYAVGREYGWPNLPAKPVEGREDAVLDAFVGEYSLASLGTLSLARDNGRLLLRFGSQPPMPLRLETETKFFAEVLDAEVMFVMDEDGQVSGLTLRQGDQNMKGEPLRPKVDKG